MGNKYLNKLAQHKTDVNHTSDKQRSLTQRPAIYLYSILFPEKGIPSGFNLPMNWGVPLTIFELIENELEFDKVWEQLELDLETQNAKPYPEEIIYTNEQGYMICVSTTWASEKSEDFRNRELIDKIRGLGLEPSQVYVERKSKVGNKSYLFVDEIELLIPSPTDRNRQEFDKILDSLVPYVKVHDVKHDKNKNAKIHMLVKGDYEMYFKDFDVSKFTPKLENADIFYGKNFDEYNQQLIERVDKNKKGVVLFHGDPGTGKTHYIRYLLQELGKINKRIIYVPPAMVEAMTDPGMVTFLTDNILEEERDTILLIEDAEPLIESREGGGGRTTGISNLLNSTDGLLNDILGLVIIATFNTDLTKIDKALLRPGRLLARKEFKKIKEENTIEAAKILGIDESKIEKNKQYSVAELLNLSSEKQTLLHDHEEERRQIGFRSN